MKRRSFILDHLLAVLAAMVLMAIYGWLVWNWSETKKELDECRAALSTEAPR